MQKFICQKENGHMGMTIDFTGKTVLVTGGGRGLGRDMALLFAECGADVMVAGRGLAACEKTAADIQALGVKGSYHLCDVSKSVEVESLIRDTLEFGGGKLDVIVHAAGVQSIDDLLLTSDEEISKVLSINVGGTANIIKHGLPVLQKQRFGNMVIISSIAARDGGPENQIYCASKAAVTSLIQSASKMAAPYGIRVNGILPGIIYTDMWDDILTGRAHKGDPADTREVSDEEKKALWEEALKVIPLGRAQKPRDISYSTAFLASDYAGEISGQCLCIDGGQTSGR